MYSEPYGIKLRISLSFNGLSEILTQIRQGVASDLKMPMTKLFGVSAAGFNAGEDDIENYNGMIESEIRSVAKFIVIRVLEVCCKYLFDKVPQNLNIDFKSLISISNKLLSSAILKTTFNISLCKSFKPSILDNNNGPISDIVVLT